MRYRRPHCNVCGRAIRGRAHRWSNRVICGSCFRYHTRHVQKTSTTIKRYLRSRIPRPQSSRSWLARLFG